MSHLRANAENAPSQRALLVLALGLYAALTLPKSLTLGLFQDGVVFASVARNMAEGLGGFWTPRFTDTAYRLEFMHPPVGPWILSHVFDWFGDRPRLEVFYSIAVGVLNLGLLALLWRTVTRRAGARCGAWLPLSIYVSMPLVTHGYASNLLENPMVSFLLLAVVMAHLAVEARSAPLVAGLAAFAGVLVFVAVQTKGPAGAHVLVYPALVGLVGPSCRWQRGLAVSGIAAAAALVATAGFILPNESAIEFTRQHYQGLVFEAFEGGNIPSQGRYSVLRALFVESLPPVVLILVAAAAAKVRPRLDPARRASIFLLLALAGTLPYLITTHQYSRYVLPALPMVAMAVAFASQELGERVEAALSHRRRVLVVAAAGALLGLGVTGAWMRAGTVSKHADFHLDFTVQPLELEGRPLFSVCPAELAVDWELVGDVQRHLGASLTTAAGHAFWLTETGSHCTPPRRCRAFHPPRSHRYSLYDCRPQRRDRSGRDDRRRRRRDRGGRGEKGRLGSPVGDAG